jgi:Tat protein secretion system quality control protein TatD with DNase activity
MPFVDSHCHINFPELAANISDVLEHMKNNEVVSALCVSVNLADFPQVISRTFLLPWEYIPIMKAPKNLALTYWSG